MAGTGRIFVHSLLLVAGAIALTSVCFHAAESVAPRSGRWLRHRVLQAMEYMDHLPGAGDAKTIVIAGSSDVEVGVDPVLVDEEFQRLGLKTRTINLGFRNTPPVVLKFLARRLEESLERQGARLDLVAVKLTPLHMTRRHAEEISFPGSSSRFSDAAAALHTPRMIARDAFSDPLRAFFIWMSRTFYSCISPTFVANYLWEFLTNQLRLWPDMKPSERAVYGFFYSLWYGSELNPEPAWDAARRGDFQFGQPGTSARLRDAIRVLEDEEVIRDLVKVQEKYYGALTLEFDPTAIAELVEALNGFKRSARKVVLIYFPDSPALGRSADAVRRLNEAIARVGREANVPVIDLSRELSGRTILGEGDYIDRFHLNSKGRTKLARQLADGLVGKFLFNFK